MRNTLKHEIEFQSYYIKALYTAVISFEVIDGYLVSGHFPDLTVLRVFPEDITRMDGKCLVGGVFVGQKCRLADVLESEYFRCRNWHQSLGALTVWLSWINLVLFMRRFPKIGIYVVMLTHIFKTFARFFMVFALFIIAFGLGFHMLLNEQVIAFLHKFLFFISSNF